MLHGQSHSFMSIPSLIDRMTILNYSYFIKYNPLKTVPYINSSMRMHFFRLIPSLGKISTICRRIGNDISSDPEIKLKFIEY